MPNRVSTVSTGLDVFILLSMCYCSAIISLMLLILIDLSSVAKYTLLSEACRAVTLNGRLLRVLVRQVICFLSLRA